MSGKSLKEMLAEINAILEEDDEAVDPDGPVRGVETLQEMEYHDSTEEDAGDPDSPLLIVSGTTFNLALAHLRGSDCREAFRREAMSQEIERISRGELQRYWTAEYMLSDGTPVPVLIPCRTMDEQNEE